MGAVQSATYTSTQQATLSEARDLIRSREMSAIAIAEEFLGALADATEFNAFITVTADRALAQAERTDELLGKGTERPLAGVALSIKDNFCTQDIETTAGSNILKGFKPTYESSVTRRILEAGATVLGKTNMDEFGMGSSTENSAYGPTLNPIGRHLQLGDLSPGGSSGGAAASVAAKLCSGALGTDTGGSIRQPAAFCGLVGFKPTYGVCSRWGIVAYASSMDQAGVITKSVRDAAILMDVIAGFDEKDSTSLSQTPSGFETALDIRFDGFTVGIPRELRDSGSNFDLESLWNKSERLIQDAGGRVVHVSLPHITYTLPTYYILALSEASSNLARYDGVRYGVRETGKTLDEMYELTRSRGFNWETKRRIMLGTFALSAGHYDEYFIQAQKVRKIIALEFDAAFEKADFLMWPTTPTPAFPLGAHDKDPVSMYKEDLFTVPVNLAGLPAVSMPVFKTALGLPMGMQLIGQRLDDTRLLACAGHVMRDVA